MIKKGNVYITFAHLCTSSPTNICIGRSSCAASSFYTPSNLTFFFLWACFLFSTSKAMPTSKAQNTVKHGVEKYVKASMRLALKWMKIVLRAVKTRRENFINCQLQYITKSFSFNTQRSVSYQVFVSQSIYLVLK